MRIDALAVRLRPRSMNEASDLGVRLAQAYARSVWGSYLPVHALVLALALSCIGIAHWLPTLVIYWLKPWLDRSLLFALSRAVFGEQTRFADLWRAQRSVWWHRPWTTLMRQRLSPFRAFTQPVYQLEGQTGAALRARRRVLLNGQHMRAGALQFAFANIETVLAVGLLAATAWFAPEGHSGDVLQWLGRDAGDLPVALLTLCYGLIVLLVEPYFVAAGFAAYLNRRVELEAWDVEQEFRRVFA
jgi:hypothetical protein